MRKTYTWFVFGVVVAGVAVWLMATRPNEVYEVRYTCTVACDANAGSSISTDGNFCRQGDVEDECLACVNPRAVDSVMRIMDSIRQDDAAISNIEIRISCKASNLVGREKINSMLSSMDVFKKVSGNKCEFILSVCDQDAEVANLFLDAYFCCLNELVREHNTRLVERSLLQTRTGIEKINRRLMVLRSTDNCHVNTAALKEQEKKLAQLVLEEARIKSEVMSRVFDIRLVKTEANARNAKH